MTYRNHILGSRFPLLSRLVNGTIWSAVSGVLNQGGTFIAAIVVARLLGPTAFGRHAIVLSTLMSVAALAQSGLAFSAAKHIAEFRSIDKARTGRIIGLCSVLCPALAVVFSLGVAGFAPFIAGHVLGSTDLAVPLALGAVFIVFFSINSYQTAALTGLERYRVLVRPSAICTPITIGCVAVGAIAGGITGAIAGLSVGTAVRCCVYQHALKSETRQLGIEISYSFSRRELSLLFGFALPATLSGYLTMPSLWLANALLVRQPEGYKEMAHYAAAQTIRLIVMFVPLLMNSVGLAILNNVRRGAAAETYSSVRRMNLIALTSFAAVTALFARVFGHSVLRVFGRDFADSGISILTVMLVSAVVETARLGFFQSIQTSGRMWTSLAAIIIPWQSTFAAASLFLVPRYAAAGLAAADLTGLSVALLATATTAALIDKPECKKSREKNTMPLLRVFTELPDAEQLP